MKRLKRQIQLFIWITVIGWGGLLLLYFLRIENNEQKILTLKTQVNNYHTVIDYFQENEEALEHYQQSVDSLKHLHELLSHKIATASSLPQVLEQTAQLFQKAGISVLAGKPQFGNPQKIPRDSLVILPIDWKLKGRFLPVVNSLEQLRRLPIKQWPVSFHARLQPNNPEQLLVEFQSNIWLRKEIP